MEDIALIEDVERSRLIFDEGGVISLDNVVGDDAIKRWEGGVRGVDTDDEILGASRECVESDEGAFDLEISIERGVGDSVVKRQGSAGTGAAEVFEIVVHHDVVFTNHADSARS